VTYPSYAPSVDPDGNEVVGIRVPDVRVPVGTHTGWMPRHPDTGGTGQLLDMMGTTLPFPASEAERAHGADPRASLAERYRDRDDYLARVRAAAQQLAAEGYLLGEDIDLAVDLAGERYDLVVAPSLIAT
jgi:Alpha/beta hydrolase domain